MEPVIDQDYYELLEVSRSGTPQQIDRAYRIARLTYQPMSTATYSVFDTEESAAILRRVEEAYAVLSDQLLRREYDARLRAKPEPTPEPAPVPPRAPAADEGALIPPPRKKRSALEAPRARMLAERAQDLELDESLEPPDGRYDGSILRRIRMSLGIELEEISTLTKVNEAYLDCLETDRYADLPATVYVRGFLQEYAKCVGLDPKAVAGTYLERMAQGR